MGNKIIPYHPKLKEYAKYLRNNSTLCEVLLWKMLKNKSLGVEFHRQVPMLDFIVDFYCHELQLVIEIDGEYHLYQYIEDCERQEKIESYGVKFLRFTNDEIKYDMQNVILKIQHCIEGIKSDKL